jgi:hypothetical protein
MRRFLPSASTPVTVRPTTRSTCGPGARARRRHGPAEEMRAEAGGDAMEGIALRHQDG